MDEHTFENFGEIPLGLIKVRLPLAHFRQQPEEKERS